MYFDTLTLGAIADELRDRIVGGRVQRVLLPSEWSVGLEIYTRGQRLQLLASAHPQFARVHLVRRKLSRGVERATPLLLLLRKYVLGGRIIAVEQPVLERVLLLSIVKERDSGNHLIEERASAATQAGDDEVLHDEEYNDDAGAEQLPAVVVGSTRAGPAGADSLRCELIIEPQDRRSNIILVDDNNLILDSVKRVTSRMSRRTILPRQVYELPPAPEKRDPRAATGAGIEALRKEGKADLARAIVAAYRAVSPQVAQEAVYRALGRVTADLHEDLPWYSVAAQLRELYNGIWAPSLVSGETGPLTYAPYRLTHMSGAVAYESMSEAVEQFYAAREALTDHRQRRDAVAAAINAGLERLRHQHAQIAGELARAQELERLRWEGEMIFAFLYSLSPGQALLELEGRTITLDPSRPAAEQAQERFRAYDKAKSALSGLPDRVAATEARIAGAEHLLVMLSLSESHEQIEQIAQEAAELGYLRETPRNGQRKLRAPRLRPLHLVSSDGFDLYVGRSARQNEEVTFRIGHVDDLWIHVRTIHGAHVIIRSAGREVPETTLREAAGLAAYFSQARDEGAVDVDIARRSLVRKVAGGPPGLVTYRAEQTLRVRPLPPWQTE